MFVWRLRRVQPTVRLRVKQSDVCVSMVASLQYKHLSPNKGGKVRYRGGCPSARGVDGRPDHSASVQLVQ